jgi:hypothetical protein
LYDAHQQFIQERSSDPNHPGHYLKDTLIGQMSRSFSLYNFPDLLYWFDFLPISVYIGGFDDVAQKYHYLNVCHGGLEPGYSPLALLTSDARFERIKVLERNRAIQQVIAAGVVDGGAERFAALFERLADIGLTDFAASYTQEGYVVDVTQRHAPRQLRLGMQWNNFLTQNNDQIDVASSVRHRNLLIGRELTRYFLQRDSTAHHEVISIMRGHQHLDDKDDLLGVDSPMLSQLRQQCGVVRQWGGAVYTMGDGGSASHWQAFVVVTTAATAQEWRRTHYFRKSVDEPFTSIIGPFVDLPAR